MTTFSLDGIPVIYFTSQLRNYFFGNSGSSNATGGANVSFGSNALSSLRAGGANVAIGDYAMAAITNTFGNIAIGRQALLRAVTPTDVTAIGDMAGANMTTGTGATLVGKFSFENVLQAYGNTGVGDSTGRFTIDGQLNTAMGYRTFEGNLHGSYNVALGAGSMLVRQAGDNNTSLGYNALGGNSTVLGSNNTVLGGTAGLKIEGSSNIAIGAFAGSSDAQNTTASNTIAIGNNTYTTTNNQIVIGNGNTQSVVLGGVSFTMVQLINLLGLAEQTSNVLQLTGTPFIDALGGDDNANVLDGGAGADLMYGEDGDDIYYIDNAGDMPFEDIGGGIDTADVASGVNYALASGTEIEFLKAANVISTATMSLSGNEFDNYIRGNAGANTFYGGGGTDILEGLGGNDTYIVDDMGDVILEITGAGTDTVKVATEITYVLPTGLSIENLRTAVDASTLNINLTGNELANTITGNAGNNIMSGMNGDDLFDGLDGNDTFLGGAGDDWFYAGTGIDIFNGGANNDALYYYLSTAGGVSVNLETGVGSGGDAEGDTYISIERVYGTNSGDVLTGKDAGEYLGGFGGVDQLRGGDGIDTLDGGAGADILDGGAGIDTAYYYRSAIGVNVNLATGLGANGEAEGDQLSNIENVVGTNAVDQITGNSGNNVLYGYGGNDSLNGGAGNDTLFGGTGTDTAAYDGLLADYDFSYNSSTQTYSVYGADGSIDQVKEVESFQFSDQTVAAASLPLGSGAPLRIASITADVPSHAEGQSGTTAHSFTVNLDAAVFSAQTVHWSAAGAGTHVTDAGDFFGDLSGTLNFAAGENSKTITILVQGDTEAEFDETFDVTLSSPSSGLSIGTSSATGTVTNDDLNLVLGTAGDDPLVGTSAADEVRGLAGHDHLDGGLGSDTLIGGDDADSFVFSTAIGSGNIDTVSDFSVADDTFELSAANFAGLALGQLAAGEFLLGTTALDGDDHILYDTVTGALAFDSDGNGANAAEQFATVQPNLTITNDDFLII